MSSSTAANLYVGSYTQRLSFVPGGCGDGIVSFAFNTHSGEIERRQTIAGLLNPSYLALDRTGARLIAAAENVDAEGTLHLFSRDKRGLLREIDRQSSLGRATCHVAIVADRLVCASAYGSGNAVLYELENERIGTLVNVLQFEGKSVYVQRQEGPHAHQAIPSPDGKWLHICDLGVDCIWRHPVGQPATPFDPALASPTPAGSGPRHLVFHPAQPRVYVLGELNARLMTYSYRAADGELILENDQETLPADWRGQPSAAAIRMHPSGRVLYVSNRIHNSLTAMRLDTQGRATWAATIASGGTTPRDFNIDPTGKWLVVGNQDSNNLAIYGLDETSGLPLPASPRSVQVNTPTCVLFA
jgi:6-phosphogluconolactonase